MSIKHLEFPDKESLHQAFKRGLLDEFAQGSQEPHAITILPGGSTPLAVYAEIGEEGGSSALSRTLVLSDERMVPVDDKNSNFRSILPMAVACGIAKKNIYAPRTNIPLDEATAEFDKRLTTLIQDGATVNTCYLGLGTDGHTASLFPDMEIPGPDDSQLAISAPKKDGPSRISITPRLIMMADKIVFLVSGQEKTQMTYRLINETDLIPAGIATKGHPNTEIWSCLT